MPLAGSPNANLQPQLAGASQRDAKDDQIEKLTKQVEMLSKKLEKVTLQKQQVNRNRSNKYCSYCRVTDHNLTECPHSPVLGCCFDCGIPNQNRGHPGCPGPSRGNRA